MVYEVDGNIPYGNVVNVSYDHETSVPQVNFSAHPHGGPEALWFCFRLLSAGEQNPANKINLVLHNCNNLLGWSLPQSIRPVIRYEGEPWQRISGGKPIELPDGRITASWQVDTPSTYLDFALCYPYGQLELEKMLKESQGFWQKDVIGVSQNGRPLLRFSNAYGKLGSQRPGLYLIARQHSGETPGSWVLEGFLRYIATLGEAAPLVWAVPLANIDGIEQGDYGKDNFPYDLNRAWGTPPMRHETLVIQRDFANWKTRCKPILGIDFHAPGACEKDGIYCFLPNHERFPQHHKQAQCWSQLIACGLGPEFASPSFGKVASHSSRWESPNFTTFCCKENICGLSFETPYSAVGDRVLTVDEYLEAGARIARAIVDSQLLKEA